MNNMIRNMMTVLLLLLGSTPALYAQYNPTNPPEPDGGKPEEVITYYKVTVTANPSSAAYTSGSGSFRTGEKTFIHTSGKMAKYEFSHWTLNGEFYSDKQYYYYTVDSVEAAFVAHYKFVPTSPVEPQPEPDVIKYPLNIVTNNESVCSFNVASGNEYEAETWVTLEAFVSKGYQFDGWYNGTVLLSRNTRFNYQIPDSEVTLTAKVSKIVFNPSNPSEPDSSQDNVQTTLTGDVNKDGVVNILDIVGVVNYSLKESDENMHIYDVNGDGQVNILDIVKVVNISLD